MASPSRALMGLVLAALPAAAVSSQPNPPVWPASVRVFGPDDRASDIQAAVDAAYARNGGQVPASHGQFSSERFAFLFAPGRYDVEVPVGYYTHVAGLGESPTDVVFTSDKGVYSEEGNYAPDVGSLDTFWRVAENFQTDATHRWAPGWQPGMLWAVSQAAPLRRVVVTNDLWLCQYIKGDYHPGYASGGYLGNAQVRGAVHSGTQQQWMTRNSAVGGWSDGVWNMVFVGTEGAPEGHCGLGEEGEHAYVTVDAAPVVSEKPFVSVDAEGRFHLNVPATHERRRGVDWDAGARRIPFEQVYVARAELDTAASINAELAKGLHVVLAPGIYDLTEPLLLARPGQVLLGLGLATLVASNPIAAVKVGNVDGVRVAGVLLQAGSQTTEALLEWGDGSHAGSAADPGYLHDLFARVGGPSLGRGVQARAKVMVRINSGHVIGDNLWLWRGDHSEDGLVKHGDNPCDTGLVVNGDDVTMYGLAVEHTLKDLTLWNGERGSTYFYQSELPYDADQSYGLRGYAGYRVAGSVAEHSAYGVGVYHYFRDQQVTVESGIVAPAHLEASFVSPLSVYLNGKGAIRHVINGKGAPTNSSGHGGAPAWYCTQTPASVGDIIV